MKRFNVLITKGENGFMIAEVIELSGMSFPSKDTGRSY